MDKLRILVGGLLGVASVWLVLNGLAVALGTMGRVSGSEFGMLITIANLISSIAVWLGLFGIWRVIPVVGQAESTRVSPRE